MGTISTTIASAAATIYIVRRSQLLSFNKKIIVLTTDVFRNLKRGVPGGT